MEGGGCIGGLTAVGLALGVAGRVHGGVGLAIGLLVGPALVGDIVGDVVGLEDVGDKVGDMVGLDLVGDAVGDAVANALPLTQKLKVKRESVHLATRRGRRTRCRGSSRVGGCRHACGFVRYTTGPHIYTCSDDSRFTLSTYVDSIYPDDHSTKPDSWS